MAVENNKLTSLDVMRDAPVIPVIVLNDVKHAVPLARALVAGGIRMLEVTLRTPQALQCIEAIAKEVPEAVAGAGTIRSAADAQASALAGGPLGKVRTGDVIRLDAVAGTLAVLVPDDEWAERETATLPEAKRIADGHGLGRELFGGMRRNVTTAEEGAVTWMNE